MAKGQRLIDAWRLVIDLAKLQKHGEYDHENVLAVIASQETVDAVKVADPELREAIKLLIEQYEHSKASDYVHNPVAHAFFHTWKKIDERGYGERKYK
ncbi:MAG: hypothetical protein J6Q53_04275 [Oscillospiraceae bacterium]|nr:hypothetical protein [Oscillospiraceae bacterium]